MLRPFPRQFYLFYDCRVMWACERVEVGHAMLLVVWVVGLRWVGLYIISRQQVERKGLSEGENYSLVCDGV